MATVKIFLDPGESELDADTAIMKALEFHSTGDAHTEQNFDDPAMVDMIQRLEADHARIYGEMIREIAAVLDEEYSDGSQ